jgi:hypothetical protein
MNFGAIRVEPKVVLLLRAAPGQEGKRLLVLGRTVRRFRAWLSFVLAQRKEEWIS